MAAWSAAMLLGAASALAQQTIFNVPSADVLESRMVYVELDAAWRPIEPRFSAFTPRVVLGVGHRIEIGANLSGNVLPGPDHTTIAPNIKWKPFAEGKSGWGLMVGDGLFIPVRHREYDVGNYFYATVVRSFSRGTRLTAGAYHFTAGVIASHAQRAGAQLTFEQAVPHNLTLAADWYSGSHALGYLTPGAIWKPTKWLTLYFAYSLGNTGVTRDNHFFLTEIGFNLD